jgi:hypothetical protein
MPAFAGPIEALTLKNRDFRRVLFTGKHAQLVLMSLLPERRSGPRRTRTSTSSSVSEGTARFVLKGRALAPVRARGGHRARGHEAQHRQCVEVEGAEDVHDLLPRRTTRRARCTRPAPTPTRPSARSTRRRSRAPGTHDRGRAATAGGPCRCADPGEPGPQGCSVARRGGRAGGPSGASWGTRAPRGRQGCRRHSHAGVECPGRRAEVVHGQGHVVLVPRDSVLLGAVALLGLRTADRMDCWGAGARRLGDGPAHGPALGRGADRSASVSPLPTCARCSTPRASPAPRGTTCAASRSSSGARLGLLSSGAAWPTMRARSPSRSIAATAGRPRSASATPSSRACT